MGIKRPLHATQLPPTYRHYPLIPTTDGVSDTVYLLGERWVLKCFESNSPEALAQEQSLLRHLHPLPVPQLESSFEIAGQLCGIYTQIAGESPYHPTLGQIRQIGQFLQQMHTKTQGISSTTPPRFGRDRLHRLIKQSHYPPLLHAWEHLDITLHNDGIIHGDLFVDNAKFQEGRLSGVYDFSGACEGDFLFDLAVVASSWCFEGSRLHRPKLHTLLQSYGTPLSPIHFTPYLHYALLYYTTTRYLAKQNYGELLERLRGVADSVTEQIQ